MTAPQAIPSSEDSLLDPCSAHLGHALALIQRALPKVDHLEDADFVDRALGRVVTEVQAAQAAHRKRMEALRPAPVEAEVLALIAAAVSVVLQGAAHRVLDVKRAAPAVTWVNAWAIEGRFQHYSSHKVR